MPPAVACAAGPASAATVKFKNHPFVRSGTMPAPGDAIDAVDYAGGQAARSAENAARLARPAAAGGHGVYLNFRQPYGQWPNTTPTKPLAPNHHTPAELLNLLTHGLGLILTWCARSDFGRACGTSRASRMAGCVIYVVRWWRCMPPRRFRTAFATCGWALLSHGRPGLHLLSDCRHLHALGRNFLLRRLGPCVARHVGVGLCRAAVQAVRHRPRERQRWPFMSCWAGCRCWRVVEIIAGCRRPPWVGCWPGACATPSARTFFARLSTSLFPRHLAFAGDCRQCLPLSRDPAVCGPAY